MKSVAKKFVKFLITMLVILGIIFLIVTAILLALVIMPDSSTSTPVSKSTSAPTDIPVPISRATSKIEATPSPAAVVTAENSNVNIRIGPGTNYEIIGLLKMGQSLQIVGKNQDASWWQVSTTEGKGWVAAWVTTAHNNDNVPVVKTEFASTDDREPDKIERYGDLHGLGQRTRYRPATEWDYNKIRSYMSAEQQKQFDEPAPDRKPPEERIKITGPFDEDVIEEYADKPTPNYVRQEDREGDNPFQQPTQKQKIQAMQEAQVIDVVDGDTIDVLIDGVEFRVRYILVDTPETKHPQRGVEPFGPEASEANRRLVEGQVVHLEKDVSETDQYGRLLRYVYVGDLMVNEELLRQGLAQVSTYPPDVKYVDRFLAVQRQAQAAGVGMWGSEPVLEQPVPTVPPPPARSPGYTGSYDPFGPDRDCGNFATHAEAQAFFIAAGGPGRDPHRLDGDHDGIACESLP